MRKTYKYLQDSYYNNINETTARQNFLTQINHFLNQKQYVKITLLDWNENPLKEISGETTSGSIAKDGSSSMRTTGNLSATFSGGEYSVEDANVDFAINKKVFIEIGIKNYSRTEYTEYPILWFPQGVFFIGSFNASSSTSGGVNISISLKDKMAGLNGDVGGKFSSTTILDEVDTQDENGDEITEKVKLYNLIQELVNHFGGEPLNNIVIEDVDLRIRRIMKWTGNNPLWMKRDQSTSDSSLSWMCTLDQPADEAGWRKFTNGDDVGYIYDDFYYTSELTAAPGDSVCTILDKIKSYLGNYEYFYDVFGVFHFREIKNYLNNSQVKSLLEDMNKNDYLVETSTSKSAFNFSDDNNIVSMTVTPSYENVKNDYVIQGKRTVQGTDITYPVMYHLAIDKKPTVGAIKYSDLLCYKEEDTKLKVLSFPLTVEKLPEVGNVNIVYRIKENNLPDKLGKIDNDKIYASVREMLKAIIEIDDNNEEKAKLTEQLNVLNEQLESLNTEKDKIDKVNTGSLSQATKEVEKLKQEVGNAEGALETAKKQLKEDMAAGKGQHIIDLDNQKIDECSRTLDEKRKQLDLTEKNKANLESQSKQLAADIAAIEAKKNEVTQKINVENTKMYPFIREIYDTHRTNKGVGESFTKIEREIGTDIQSSADANWKVVDILSKVRAALSDEKNTDLSLADNVVSNTTGFIDGYAFLYWKDMSYKFVDCIKYYDSTKENDNYICKDWRTELYLRGKLSNNNATDAGQYYYRLDNYIPTVNDMEWVDDLFTLSKHNSIDVDFYYQELNAFWPTIYDLEKQEFIYDNGLDSSDDATQYFKTFTNGNYFLDFIDPDESGMEQFAIGNIGRRTDVVTNEDVNCLFEPEIPNVIFINTDDETTVTTIDHSTGEAKTELKWKTLQAEANEKQQDFCQVNSNIFYGLYSGGNHNAAYDQIKYELYLHTTYQKTISMTAIPAWYLEPNTRITVNDKSTNTYGDFNAQNITLSLGPSASMSITLNECLERF